MSDEINADALTQIRELMGDKFSGLVETYLRSGHGHVDAIRKGFESGNAQMVVDSAHPLKSSSGNMGLQGLSEAATLLEAKARDVVDGGQGLDGLEGLVLQIETLFQSGEAYLLKG